MRTKTRSVLLKTSAASDVQHSGGTLSITGLLGIRYNDILDFTEVKQRAEVVKVTRLTAVGTTAPTADTVYQIKTVSPERKHEGWTGYERIYGYKTPVVLTNIGATAALQNEYITTQLLTKINADSSNFLLGATVGSGNGFTLTDDAGYFPARLNGASGGRAGASNIYAITNIDGSGYAQTQLTDTTAAVYSFGDGTRMQQDQPVLHGYSGNIISGEISAPTAIDGTFATPGQLYDAYMIESLCTQSAHAVTDQIAHALELNVIWVDNGKGTSVANLAGSKAFEREMQKALFGLYSKNSSTTIEWFDSPIVFQDPLGAAATGTADVLGLQLSKYTGLNRTNIGTQTIIVPVLSTNGLLIDQDDTAGEGSHTSASEGGLSSQSFIVGKTDFSVVSRVVMADWTDAQILIGFRKKAVYAPAYDNYTDLAAIGSGAAAGDTITTHGILNNAATVHTASAVSFVDGVSAEFIVKVNTTGLVTASVDGVVYPIYSAGTTALVLDAGDEMIPFYQIVNIGSGNPAAEISSFVAVPSASWIA